MKWKLLLPVTVLICYIRLKYLTPQNLDIPSDLKTWCPHTSFCDQKINTTFTTEKDNVEPCCSSCSCSQDCGRKRNCCKYNYDVYRLDETLDTICKQLIGFSNIEVSNTPYYHIINKCPNRSEICSCSNVTGPKSYFPVYSRQSGMLYFNEECAACHKQVNVTRFVSLLTCEKTNFGFLQRSTKEIVESDCTLRLIPPNNIDLSTEMCYPFLISTCDVFINERYVELCQSFNATFRTQGQKRYRNVFCYLCSTELHDLKEKWLENFEFCPTDENQKVIGDLPYAVLLDNSRDLPMQEELLIEKNKMPLLCEHNTKADCRPRFCPEGQKYLEKKCQYLGEKWYFKMLRINVKLVVPITYKKILSTDCFYGNGSSDTTVFLHRHGLQDSQLTLSYNLASDNKTINFFLAMLYYERRTIEPKAFMEKLKISLRSSWRLYMNKKVFILKPQLNRFLRYEEISYEVTNTHLPDSFKRIEYLSNVNDNKITEEVIRFATGRKSVYEIEKEKGALFITKLFFCNLVELNDHEFEDHYVLLVMNNGTDFFADGEFTWVYTQGQLQKPFICSYDLPGLSGCSFLGLIYGGQLLVAILILMFIGAG